MGDVVAQSHITKVMGKERGRAELMRKAREGRIYTTDKLNARERERERECVCVLCE